MLALESFCIVARPYLLSVLIAIDILANAVLLGRPYTTISHRIGESILADGWASRVAWPARWRRHFLNSVYNSLH